MTDSESSSFVSEDERETPQEEGEEPLGSEEENSQVSLHEEGSDHEWLDPFDEEPDDNPSRTVRWLGICLFLLVLVTAVLHCFHTISMWLPPPEVEPMEEVEPLPEFARQFTLVMKPCISGHGGERKPWRFGRFFAHYPGDENDTCVTMNDLQHSTDAFQRAALDVALAWIHSNPKKIFKTIGNFGIGKYYKHYGYGRVKFQQVTRNGDYLVWKFQETVPGRASRSFLFQLEHEVRTGSDSWDGDDFQSVTKDIAKQHDFVHIWQQLGLEEDAHIRVSLADKSTYIVDAQNQRLTPMQRECQNNVYGAQTRAWYI